MSPAVVTVAGPLAGDELPASVPGHDGIDVSAPGLRGLVHVASRRGRAADEGAVAVDIVAGHADIVGRFTQDSCTRVGDSAAPVRLAGCVGGAVSWVPGLQAIDPESMVVPPVVMNW